MDKTGGRGIDFELPGFILDPDLIKLTQTKTPILKWQTLASWEKIKLGFLIQSFKNTTKYIYFYLAALALLMHVYFILDAGHFRFNENKI
jgi:hypothetical protein